MFNFIIDMIKSKILHVLLIPASLNTVSFFALLFDSLKDGELSASELHQLITAASGVELFVLIIVMLILKCKK